jgi:hypothetical protein
MAFLLSYSTTIFDAFSSGITVKYINHTLADYSANGFGLDLGFQFNLNRSLRLGIMLQDLIGARIKINNRTDVYPLKFRFGAAYNPVANLMLVSEMRYLDNNSLDFNFGGEFGLYKDVIFIRGGYTTLLESWSAGIGLAYWEFKLDYSYNSHDELGGTNKFGITINF